MPPSSGVPLTVRRRTLLGVRSLGKRHGRWQDPAASRAGLGHWWSLQRACRRRRVSLGQRRPHSPPRRRGSRGDPHPTSRQVSSRGGVGQRSSVCQRRLHRVHWLGDGYLFAADGNFRDWSDVRGLRPLVAVRNRLWPLTSSLCGRYPDPSFGKESRKGTPFVFLLRDVLQVRVAAEARFPAPPRSPCDVCFFAPRVGRVV